MGVVQGRQSVATCRQGQWRPVVEIPVAERPAVPVLHLSHGSLCAVEGDLRSPQRRREPRTGAALYMPVL